jgi:anti-sigma regulatory factor (Ser/Thr protein kinase)
VSVPILSLAIRDERDVVAARRRARQIAELLEFDVQDQTRVATAVSEIARNAFTYAGGGKVEFFVEGKTSPQLFVVRIADRGPGIPELDRVLDGQYRSTSGMGLGITGTRRLMDHFSIESSPRGTLVSLKKIFSRRAPLLTPARAARITAELSRRQPDNPLGEVQQ